MKKTADEIDLRELVTATLQFLKYDGLFNARAECACLIDDLMPCRDPGVSCSPGYKHTGPYDGCEDGGGCEHDWHVAAEKPGDGDG